MVKREASSLVKKAVEEVMTKVRRLIDETYLPKLVEKTNTHEKILRGNGKRGLVEEIAVLSDHAKRMDKHVDTFEEFIRKSGINQQFVTDALRRIENTQQMHKADIDRKFETMSDRFKPLEEVITPYLKSKTVIGTVSFIVGAIIVFLLSHYKTILEVLTWIVNKPPTP